MKRLLALAMLLAACYPATTRPDLLPLPDAPQVEIELFVPQATRALALALDADSALAVTDTALPEGCGLV